MEPNGDQVRFGGHRLDLRTGELHRGNRRIELRPLATRCLVCLVKRAERLATFEELRAELWGDTVVDWRGGLHQAIRQIRLALEDTDHSIVESVPRRGYRLAAPVEPARLAGPWFRRPWAYAMGLMAPIVAFFLYCLVCTLVP